MTTKNEPPPISAKNSSFKAFGTKSSWLRKETGGGPSTSRGRGIWDVRWWSHHWHILTVTTQIRKLTDFKYAHTVWWQSKAIYSAGAVSVLIKCVTDADHTILFLEENRKIEYIRFISWKPVVSIKRCFPFTRFKKQLRFWEWNFLDSFSLSMLFITLYKP